MFDDIKEFFDDILQNIRVKIKNVFVGVCNLVKWFPIIWNDRQFDYNYILILLHFKLKLMHTFFDDDNKTFSVNSKKTANQIKICFLLLDRLLNKDYCDLAGNEFLRNKYGDIDYKMISDKNHPAHFSMKRILSKNLTEEEIGIYNKQYDKNVNYSRQIENNDMNYLFDTMKKYIFSWWD